MFRPCGLSRELDVLAQARAVDLLVVGHEDLRAAVLLHERRESGALNRVLRDDARIGPRAGGVVLVGLARVGARLVRGQAHSGVRGADLRDPGLIEDRDRDRGGARVELADVDGGAVVLSDLAGVGLRGLRRPRAGLGRRVVERLVLDREVAGLAARLVQRELDAVDKSCRLRTGGALERKRRVDGEGLAPAAAAATAVATTVVVAATGGDAHRKRADEAACRCQPAWIQGTPPHKRFDLGGDSTHALSGRATDCHEARQISRIWRTAGCAAVVSAPGGYPGGTARPRGRPRRSRS